jgi:hypothetical protein
VTHEAKMLAPAMRPPAITVVIVRESARARHEASDLARRADTLAELLGESRGSFHVTLDVDVTAHVRFAEVQLRRRSEHPPQPARGVNHQSD